MVDFKPGETENEEQEREDLTLKLKIPFMSLKTDCYIVTV